MNKTMTNVINDCRDQVHFSKKLLENYWFTLDNAVKDMMNTLSKQIFDQFIKSIEEINIQSDQNLLVQFVNTVNVSNIRVIVHKLDTDLSTIQIYFDEISSSNSTLRQSLVQTTIVEVS
jgi:hypothetical protein